MIYSVINKTSGLSVYEYQADTPIEWEGMEFSTHDHVEVSAPVHIEDRPTKFGGRRILTKLEFRSLFPESAIKAIDRFEVQFEQAAFLNNDQKDEIRTSFKNYNAAEDVNLDDPRWVPGLGLYVALGMMTADDVSEVLNG